MGPRIRILLWSALSGLLWAAAWPAVGGLAWLAFVAWLPLLYAERLHDQRGSKRSFVPYVLVSVFVWNATTSWWFFAVSEPLSTRLVSGLTPMTVNSLLMIIPWWLKRLVRRHVGAIPAAYGFVFFWLGFEYLHHDWDLQWPWFSIGNVFGERPEWIQWYAYTGMMGGSLWVLVVNLLLDHAWASWSIHRSRSGALTIGTALLIIMPISFSLWRFWTLPTDTGRAIEVVVVQPNIDPYTEKFGGVEPMSQLDRMLELAASAATDTTALIAMPETALQEGATLDMYGDEPILHGLWENDLATARSTQRLEAFQDRFPNAALLTGMSADVLYPRHVEPPVSARPLFPPDRIPASGQRWYEAYNAALFLPSEGPVEHYNKSKLVAGVELMPFERVLGPLGDLALDLGGTSGSLGTQEERKVLVDPASGLRIAPAICYESVFGEHVAAHIRNGANLIAIITNDGWWGDTPGYGQHLTFATIRAIETRRDVVRSANTGISCFVDRKGVIHQPTAWWKPTAIRGTVHLYDEVTFYVRHGDQVGRVSVACSVLLLLLVVVRVIKRRT
ncbi:MAG TPA: apolipoprotein N-acyltransferase [Flavobacteriales bacterium]|nr:apolipoprotein N-acyltransferase [Flavobacteriales bacterium]